MWLIFTRRGVDINDYPAIKKHLTPFKAQLKPKPDNWNDKKQGGWPGRKAGSYEWFNIQDNIAYWTEFEMPKIILARFMNQPTYAWDDKGLLVFESYLYRSIRRFFASTQLQPIFHTHTGCNRN